MIKRIRPKSINILDAVDDPAVFGRHFKDPNSWMAWRVFLASLFGLPLNDSQRSLFRQCTNQKTPQPSGYTEAWLCCGRRSGKSFTLSLIAVFLACFKDWRPHLAPGERGTVMVIAADRKQARVIMRYVKGLIESTPMLASMVQSDTADSVSLKQQVVIEVHTASFKTTRGYTLVAALCDELAFWGTDDAAEPDHEIIAAIRPGLATIPGSMLLCASSPYARKGALWEAVHKHHGRDGDPVLVWQAPTRVMNPTIPQSVIDEALERDPASAQAEYLAQFRSDIESFINREAIEACVSHGIYERPAQSNLRYVGFVDPSGGSADSFTLGIAHKDGDQVILDALRESRPPFSPESVVLEFCDTLKQYGISKVQGDRYAGEWPREQFRKLGISYEPSPKPKSDLYRDLLPLLNSRRVELLDHPKLINQLVNLERRTARSGRDSIDHPPGQHDDVANAVAGALLAAHAAHRSRIRMWSQQLTADVEGCELDPSTGRPLEPPRLRIRVVKVSEHLAPAAKGP